MSDFNSSLPVRTETNGDVAAKIVDGTITSQALAVDSSGRITVKLDDSAGNGITSVTNGAQQALSVQVQSAGPVAAGTVASFSDLIGGQFNTTLPTLTTGQQAAIQVDNRGRLLVMASISNDTNYGVVGANTLRVASQIGNATGAADFNAGATSAQTLRVQANQGAPGTNANAWFVHPTDGINNQSFTATGQATVIVTSPLPAGTNNIGIVTASNFPTTLDTNYGVVGASTLRTAAQIGNSTGAADFNAGATSAQTLRTVSNQGAANSVANAWPISITSGGALNSATNPIFVSTTDVIGTPIDNYQTSAALAAGSSITLTYTVTAAKTFYSKQFWISGSGKIKAVVQYAAATFWVGFNSTAETNILIPVPSGKTAAAGTTISVIITNDDKQPQDVYCTISGVEI
jgi:hypothetical protein